MRERGRVLELQMVTLLEDGDNPGAGSLSQPGLSEFLKLTPYFPGPLLNRFRLVERVFLVVGLAIWLPVGAAVPCLG